MTKPDCSFGGPQLLLEAESSLPAAFDFAASMHGPRLALVSDKLRLTYDELSTAANRLARALLARGSMQGDRVVVLMHHDAPAVVAILAVLKAGCIAVPINVTHPPVRMRQVTERTDPVFLIVDEDHRDLAREIVDARCGIIVFGQDEIDGPANLPSIATAPDDVAVLIGTSGSTGVAKVVMATHRHLLRHGIVLAEAMAYSAADRIALFGALDGTQAMGVVFSTLTSGASLHPFPVMVKGVTGLASWMIERQISVWISSASIFRNFMATLDDNFKFEMVRAVRLASESATENDVRLFREHFTDRCMLVHALASSETGNVAWSRYSYGETMPEGRLAVGRPSRGHEVLIVDEDGQPVAPGEIGEIVVRGRYIARGYWNEPEMTAASFSGSLDGGGTRQFRSGDLGRIGAEGLLEFYGRKDNRVKIRGNRIELTHVQIVLQRLPGIAEAIVDVVERPDHEPLLVAFLTPTGKQQWSHVELRRAARRELPDYMVPSRFVVLDRFPLTATGKIDRQKLKQDQAKWSDNHDVTPPLTATEIILADIWCEVFGLQEIDRNADFFELGGDSLTAAVVAARVHAATGAELNLGVFADHPSLAALGAVIDELRLAAKPPQAELTPVPRSAPLVLSYFQERAWIASRHAEGRASYTHVDRYRLDGKVAIDALRESMDFLVRRHESLRTTFVEKGGRPAQIVHPPQEASFEFVDFTGAADPHAEADALGQELARRPIDLGKLPLLHFSLARVGPDRYWLFRLRHHIISDAWSSKLYFSELAQLYSARLRGDAPPLPETQEVQYADYAVWQRSAFDPRQPSCRDTLAWWKRMFADSPKPTDLPFKRQSRVRRKLTSMTQRFGLVQLRDPADGIICWGLEPQVTGRLAQLGRAQGASFHIVRLATFVALLANECNVDDVILATYVTARNRLPLQTIYGLFADVMPLRFRCDPAVRFRDWLKIVRDRVQDFYAHGEIPSDQLRNALRGEGVRLPSGRLVFNVTTTRTAVDFPGFKLSWSDQQFQTMPWGFAMICDSHAEDRNCRTLFDAHVYDPADVRRFVDRYRHLLAAVSQGADLSVAELLDVSRGSRPPDLEKIYAHEITL